MLSARIGKKTVHIYQAGGWHKVDARLRKFVHHPDPLAMTSNWVAVAIGTHLPFWPLYVLWSAGRSAWPSSLASAALSPVFLLIPMLSRRSSLLGRLAMLLAGLANTVFTDWVLGQSSGTELFFAPCAALAAISFRRSERWLMLIFTALPFLLWLLLQHYQPPPLHHYDDQAAHQLFLLNAISITVLVGFFGWFQCDVYRRMERPRRGENDRTNWP
jgi:hypothetical protein